MEGQTTKTTVDLKDLPVELQNAILDSLGLGCVSCARCPNCNGNSFEATKVEGPPVPKKRGRPKGSLGKKKIEGL